MRSVRKSTKHLVSCSALLILLSIPVQSGALTIQWDIHNHPDGSARAAFGEYGLRIDDPAAPFSNSNPAHLNTFGFDGPGLGVAAVMQLDELTLHAHVDIIGVIKHLQTGELYNISAVLELDPVAPATLPDMLAEFATPTAAFPRMEGNTISLTITPLGLTHQFTDALGVNFAGLMDPSYLFDTGYRSGDDVISGWGWVTPLGGAAHTNYQDWLSVWDHPVFPDPPLAPPVPEPVTLSLLGLGLVGMATRGQLRMR